MTHYNNFALHEQRHRGERIGNRTNREFGFRTIEIVHHHGAVTVTHETVNKRCEFQTDEGFIPGNHVHTHAITLPQQCGLHHFFVPSCPELGEQLPTMPNA